MAERKQLMESFSWNTLTVVLQVVIQLVYTAVLARWIVPEDFALMGVVLSIMGFAEIFSQVGIGPALIQRKEITQAHINGAFWTAVGLGLTFTLLFEAMSGWLQEAYSMPKLAEVVQLVCTSFLISALSVVPRSLMMREMRFKQFFIASMVSIVGGNVVVGLTLAFMNYGVWAYAWALFAQNALMSMAYWWMHPGKVGFTGTGKGVRELLHYGTGSTLFNALNYAATKVDVSLVPLGLPSSQLALAGMYERSAYVVSLPITIMAKLSDNVLFSGMSKMQDQTERLTRLVLMTTHMLSLITVPLSIWVMWNAETIMVLYLGPQYSGSGDVLRFLFVAVIFRTLNRVSDSLLRALDATFKASWIKALYVLMMGLGTWIAVPYGVKYVGLAIALSTLVHFIMGAWLGQKLLHGHLFHVFEATLSGWKLGLLVMLTTGPVMLAMGETGMSLIGSALLTGVVVAVWIWKRPGVLGKPEWHPYQFLKRKS